MIQRIFTIYDQKAQAYLLPFFLPEKAMAQRVFTDCVNSDTHQFGKHPADYSLFCVGSFDDSTAKFDTNHLESLGSGVEYLANPNSPEPANEEQIDVSPPIQPGS